MLGGDVEIKYQNTRREMGSSQDQQLAQLEASVKRGNVKEGSAANARR